jgi:hypothetical protein
MISGISLSNPSWFKAPERLAIHIAISGFEADRLADSSVKTTKQTVFNHNWLAELKIFFIKKADFVFHPYSQTYKKNVTQL